MQGESERNLACGSFYSAGYTTGLRRRSPGGYARIFARARSNDGPAISPLLPGEETPGELRGKGARKCPS